ncbi:DUF2442 domain-containing protein [Pelagibacterium sediminicola]|uniref:DUF2442 domain-containing protein n=1 Tax=Pelagibacterium sediminicola TaxID=2248761 RepID=UPI0013001BC2|nr:DUF2442 domain-containing protein [Pelagibacterium sediminicola]
MLTKVTSLTVLSPYRLAVRFNDGTSGIHDCAKLVSGTGSLLEDLRRPEFFARASLEYGAPTWPNGFDMDAEWLRREMEQAGELEPDAAAQ